eukprot:6202700-Pleurochrysis_carterae.AAC.2
MELLRAVHASLNCNESSAVRCALLIRACDSCIAIISCDASSVLSSSSHVAIRCSGDSLTGSRSQEKLATRLFPRRLGLNLPRRKAFLFPFCVAPPRCASLSVENCACTIASMTARRWRPRGACAAAA